jgi:hypothetical protein
MSVPPESIYAVLFGAGVVDLERLAATFDTDVPTIQNLVEELENTCEEQGRGVTLRRRRTGVELVTREEYAPWVRRVHQIRPPRRLSDASKETLIILLRSAESLTREEIASIRGPSLGKKSQYIDVSKGWAPRSTGESDPLPGHRPRPPPFLGSRSAGRGGLPDHRPASLGDLAMSGVGARADAYSTQISLEARSEK